MIIDPDSADISKQDPDLRYEHIIQSAVSSQEIWGCGTAEGWSLVQDKNRQKVFLVWPAEDFAAAWIASQKGPETPRRIPLAEFLETWVPRFLADGIRIGVFPTPIWPMAVCLPDAFKEDIEEEAGTLPPEAA